MKNNLKHTHIHEVAKARVDVRILRDTHFSAVVVGVDDGSVPLSCTLGTVHLHAVPDKDGGRRQ